VSGGYLLAGQQPELERLQVQARVWEPAGRAVLQQLESNGGRRALDVGCGAMGLLRPLSEWVGASGTVVGSDVDPQLLAGAASFVQAEGLRVHLVEDDLFASAHDPASFDLLHGRFLMAPLGRGQDQLDAHLRLVRPGGYLFLEEPDSASWRLNPPAEAADRLIELIVEAFAASGGDFDAGRTLPALLRGNGLDPEIRAHVVALPPGHPYLPMPLQLASSLEQRIEAIVGAKELAALQAQAERELADADRWGTSFTLIQAIARV
jgi:SAM-dependent methyltransferase